MDKVGVGVIGCGFVGRGAHLPALGSIEGASLAAAADPDPRRLEKAARKHPVRSTYQDSMDLIRDPAVEAVVVAAPTPLHARLSLAAIDAGKHVLCEMPLAPDLRQADEVIEAASRKGVILMPGLNFRFTPNYVKAKQSICAGAIGKPAAALYREFIPARDLASQWPAGSWVWKVDESGGPLYTLAVWSIDLLRWLFDTEVAEVHASTRYAPLEKFGGTLGYNACASLWLANGVTGSLLYSGSVTAAASASILEVIGDSTSMLRASGNDALQLMGEDPARTEWDLKEPGARGWGHHQQDEHFVQCIRERRAPSIRPEDGRRAMEVALQIARASR